MEITDCNAIIDGRIIFDEPMKNDFKTYATDPYFKKYELIAIDLSKQQKLDADPKAIQRINFTGNLTRAEGATMHFIIKEAKEIVLDFSKGAF